MKVTSDADKARLRTLLHELSDFCEKNAEFAVLVAFVRTYFNVLMEYENERPRNPLHIVKH